MLKSSTINRYKRASGGPAGQASGREPSGRGAARAAGPRLAQVAQVRVIMVLTCAIVHEPIPILERSLHCGNNGR